ncbi:MAG: winged helix-turn-helix transcriptional regulator [Methanobacteriota archaeon]|nr:MAG: winged helix-turn-helix transcriptional regulator [Euryarchaeota archaeon]
MDPFKMFSLVLDKHTSKILDLTSESPLNATELSRIIGIPLAACYRRIRMLREAGLIREDIKTLSEGGKSVSSYRSTIESAKVVLREGRLSINMTVDGEDSDDEIDFTTEASMLWWQRSPSKTPAKRDINEG